MQEQQERAVALKLPVLSSVVLPECSQHRHLVQDG